MPLLMKRPDGTVTPYKNSEYIPAYLLLPKVILDQCPQDLRLPRTVRSYIRDRAVIAAVESDLFIELIIDAYAFLVWPYLGVSGYMENYSGYDPVYIIAHSPAFWIQTMQDEGLLPAVENLMRYGQSETMGYTPEAEINAMLEQSIPTALERYNLSGVIETAKTMRCAEDFDARRSNAKTDFYRRWYHTRSKHAEYSMSDLGDERSDDGFEEAAISEADVERFLTGLKKKDRLILELRLQGYSLEEIAARLGYKNHSGVLKRIRKVGKEYERYAGVRLGFESKKCD